MKNFLVIIALFLFALNSSAEINADYKIVEKDGERYYEYVVKASEGVWGISKKFKVSQSDIYRVNPDAQTGLKAGQTILIPVSDAKLAVDSSKKDVSDLLHVVMKGQTIYSISKIYGLTVDELLDLNPGAELGIKIGESLVVKKKDNQSNKANVQSTPAEPVVTHLVKRKETLYSISRKYGVQIHDIITLNPEVEKGLKVGTTIYISGKPQSDDLLADAPNAADNKKSKKKPKWMRKSKAKDQQVSAPVAIVRSQDSIPSTSGAQLVDSVASSSSSDSKTDIPSSFKPSKDRINVAILLPFMSNIKYSNMASKKFIEMYKGMLLAMKDMKAEGSSFVVNTYDTQKSKIVLDSLFALPALQNADVIIGPAYPEEVPMVLNFSKSRNIPCIVPLSNNIADEFKYDNLVQFNPSLKNIVDELFLELFTDKNVQYVFAKTERCNNKGAVVANLIIDKFNADSLPYTELIVNAENIDTLQSLVAQDSVMLVFANSDDEQVRPILNKIRTLNLTNMSIFGYDNWSQDVLSICPNTYYYSVFDILADMQNFELNYLKWFGNKSASGSVKYDVIGYDLFALALDIVIKPKSGLYTNDISNSLYLQSIPDLKYFNKKGYMNISHNLFLWNGFEMLKVK